LNLVHRVGHTPAIVLERFEHDRQTPHRDPERERAAGHAINFVCSDSFRVRTYGPWRVVTAGCLFVTTPGLEFSCAHDEEYPQDRCLSVRYSESAIESLRSAGAGAAVDMRTGRTAVREATNRHAYLRHGLVTAPPGDDARLEALAGALYWTLGRASRRRPLYRAHRLAWYAARIDRAKELMRAEFGEPLALSRIAGEVGMSLYPFARLFAELEGETPHRFLIGVRLEEAARQLRAGGRVTDVCYAVGFGSLSHFITTFRRRYGLPPAAFRRSPPR
jgi:AraC family transcriptional regulator